MRNPMSKRMKKGQSMVEYALILALIAIFVILVMNLLGVSVAHAFCSLINLFGGEMEVCESNLAWLDDFTDLSKWNFTNGNGWKLKDGQLCVEKDGEHRGFSGDETWTDYTVNLSGADLTHGNGYGVYFRVSNEPNINGYVFQYDPGYRGGAYPNGAFIIRKVINGKETGPIGAAPAPADFQWDKDNRNISINIEGDNFDVSIDGNNVLSVSDNQFPTGQIGLRSWDRTRACFDGMSVTIP